MEDKKKPIMIAIIVVCIGLAVAITIMTRTPGEEEVLNVIDPTEMIWVKCRNPDCGSIYEFSKKEHAKFEREKRDPETGAIPGMVCKDCGQETVYRIEKCEKCGAAFERGSVPETFSDRCPECGYSKEEARRKASRERK